MDWGKQISLILILASGVIFFFGAHKKIESNEELKFNLLMIVASFVLAVVFVAFVL